MKNILIPTDFSENSWNAIQYALTFYKKVNCNFYLFNIVEVYFNTITDAAMGTPSYVIDQAIEVEPKRKLQELLKRIQALELNPHHNFVIMSEYDSLVEGIRKAIEKYHIDMIIMGTKGASGLKEKTVGTHTADVIVKVKCPMLVIPEDAQFLKFNEIVFPSDFRMLYSSKIAEVLKEVALLHNAAIRFLYIAKKETDDLDEGQQLNKNAFLDHFKGYDHSFHKLTNSKLEMAIQSFVESRDTAMIAMVAKNLNFYQQILFNPTVTQISYHTKVPFLILHE